MPTPRYIAPTLFVASVIAFLPVAGQTVTAPGTVSPRTDEAPIVLSPFEVRTDSDVGYLAANSLAGSRLNTALKDTPASISVFTEEFIRDLGAIDLSEIMPYAANAQFDYAEASDDARVTLFQENAGFTRGSNAAYRVRGVRATTSRNYFEWDLASDTYNIGRVEDSRGPNAVLFGFGSAGRLHLDSQWVNWHRDNRADYYRVALTHEFEFGRWGNYRLAARGEFSDKVARSRSPMQVWYDDTTGRAAFSAATPEASANFVYRRQYVTEGAWETYLVPAPGPLEHVYEPVSRRTLSARWVDRNNGLIDRRDRQTTGMIGGQARYFQGRLVAGFGFRKDELDTRQYSNRRNATTLVYELDYDPARATTQDFSGETSTLGLVWHLTPWLSLRGNQAYNLALPNTNVRILGTQAGTPVGATGVIRYGPLPKGNGRDLGASFDLFENRVSLRATYFETYTEGATGSVFLNNTSPSGILVGFGALDGLVGAGLITRAKATELEYYADASAQTYDVGSEGWELGLTANPTSAWRLQANWSTSNSFRRNLAPEVFAWAAEMLPYFEAFPLATVMGNRGNTLRQEFDAFKEKLDEVRSLDGRAGSGGRKYKVNLFTSYSFKAGRLRGLTVGGGYQHQSKLLIRRDLATDVEVYGNSYWDSNAMLRYQFRSDWIRFIQGVSVQLNVTNVFDNVEPLAVRKETNGLVVRYVVRQPRSWRLATNLSF